MKDKLKAALTVLGLTLGIGGITLLDFSYSPNYEAPEPVSAEEAAKQADINNRDNGLEALRNEDYFSALSYFMAISDASSTVDKKGELVGLATNGYLTDIISKADSELDYDNFNEAKNLLQSAIKLLDENEELTQKYNYALLREELYKICCENNAGQALTFIKENEETFANDKYVAELQKSQRDKYLTELQQKINTAIDNDNYDEVHQMLSEAVILIGECEEINDCNEQVAKAEVKNYLENLETNKKWREILDYLNANPQWKKVYSGEYSSAWSDYRDEILDSLAEAVNTYDLQYAKELVLAAVDMLGDDSSFNQYYKKYKDYDSSKFYFCPIVNQESLEVASAFDIYGHSYDNVMQVKHSNSEKTFEFRLPEKHTRLYGTLFICQTEQYKYTEKDDGTTTVTFLNDQNQVIATFDGITYKDSRVFDIDISNVNFLTVKIKKSTSRTVILGIRDGVLE